MGEWLAISALFMFSANVIATKAASGRLDLNTGFLISIVVNVLFSGCLFLIRLLVDGHPVQFHWFGFIMFMISGIVATYLGRTLYFDSIAKLGPSKASAFMVSNPLFTVLISWIFLGERLHLIECAAVVVVLFGLFLVSYVPQKSAKPVSAELSERETAAAAEQWNVRRRSVWQHFQPGVLLALFGSISYSLGNITRGEAVQDWNEPVLGAFIGALVGLSLQLLFNKQARNVASNLRYADPKGIWLYALSGMLTISAQIAQIAAMHYIPISIATLITMAQPLVVIPLSYFLLKNQEGINARTVIGSLLVLLGIGAIILY